MRALRREDGFTLVEMMVVILIVAILIAIAIPTYLGFRTNSFNVAAKTASVTSLKAAKGIYADSATYALVTPVELKATEVSLDYVDGATASSGPTVVSTDVPDPSTFVASVYSQSGTCFFIRDDMSGTSYATLTTGTADCYAANAAVVFGASWP